MTYTAVDCQGFAGGFTLGMVQAGFELLSKCEQRGGFGLTNCESNRHLLGEKWDAQVGDPADWETRGADVHFGNPPCSGFSLLSSKEFRGIDSPVNACMYAFADYAARALPYVAVFESVQQAYTGGLPLMRHLRDRLEYSTSQRWDLYHVLHNNASVGGASIRRRYFWLVSRIPFGIERPEVDRVPHLEDVIGDLVGMHSTWHLQHYRRPPSWWLQRERIRNGHAVVDGHQTRRPNAPDWQRTFDLLNGTHWDQGETLSAVCRRYYETHGRLPEVWGEERLRKLLETEWRMSFQQPMRWRWGRVARVVTGASMYRTVHPEEPRFLTHREMARIQGFPDSWRIEPLRGVTGAPSFWGKGIPVQAGRWIGEWIRRALDGEPGSYVGEETGERERVIDVTDNYRRVCAER